MSRAREANRDQQFLLPPSLDEWLPADHPARFVADLVDSLDLDALGFRESVGETGRPHYGREMLLGVWLFGWMERIRSSRALEKACLRDLAFLWLTGNQHPDHNTIWRFFRDNRKALTKLFKQSVRVAADAGLIGFALHAVDGTKMQAASSTETALHREQLRKALKRLDAETEAEVAKMEQREEQEDARYPMPAEMRDREVRKKAISASLARLEEKDAEHLHPDEPDARVMKLRAGTMRLAYNAQAVVDHDSDLIVAADVTDDATDHRMLPAILQQVLETLGEVAETSVADTGYWAGGELMDARMRGFRVAVPPQTPSATGPYAKENFRYDADANVYICPQGTKLVQIGTQRDKGLPQSVYQCSNKACPVRGECTTSKTGRVVKRTAYDVVLTDHAKRMQQPWAMRAIELRKEIVEHAFGGVKWNDGFRRFTVRGEAGVRAQWALAVTAVNLRKMHTLWRAGRLQLTPRR